MSTPLPPQPDQSQDEVFAFLADPTRHPHVKRIDTHAASVFLEGDRALKIKRAVRFPFLDYSTLDKRKAACDEELRINRPFAPDIYRRVIAITRAQDGSLSVDGCGIPIEYAVEMARFNENQTIDHLAAAGELPELLAVRMAEAVAASHAAAARAPTKPWIDSIPTIIEQYIAACRAGSCFVSDEIDDLQFASQTAFAGVRAELEKRGREGHVRRCHGDLHLANIVLIGDKPTLFDAIEFDERIASIDVLYDLAFLLMDLLHYGQRAPATYLLNRYLAISSIDHLDGLAALPLFMSMRSAIRSQVLLARIDQGAAEHADLQETATGYFQLARRLIHPPAPMLIAVGGLSGTGKSVLAKTLAPFVSPEPGAILLRTDVVRKQLFGVQETARLPAEAYEPGASDRVYDVMMQRAARVVSHGYSVVLDGVFAREGERAAVAALANAMNIPFAGFFLEADLATRQARVGARKADASDATPDIATLQEGYDLGKVDWTAIDATGSPEMTLARCRARLASFNCRDD
jgi:aminoglycoside phosphotransferase family enzyme/predicted kinase